MTTQRFETAQQRVPAVLLVGGMGTRLQAVLPAATPKPLARLGGTPFLQLLIRQLRAQGFRHVVMCTGHLADQIEEEFGNGSKWDITIDYSKETEPLGTGGAVKLAGCYLADCSDFVVMNGDSFLEINLRELIDFHLGHKGALTMAIRQVPSAARYGTVQVNESSRIVAFDEKQGIEKPGLINGGVYVFKRAVLECMPDGPSSLENDVFPLLINDGIFAVPQDGMFIDIGTPEDYARAQVIRKNLEEAAQAGF